MTNLQYFVLKKQIFLQEFNKINTYQHTRPKLLIAPLDWGLGHATRCIPIIKNCLNTDCEVIIAAEKAQAQLLQNEFPQLKIVALKGYRLHYGQNSWQTIIKILIQIPKILTAINREKRWLQQFLEQEKIDAVISDNRYGMFSKKVLSIFVTHQLLIKLPFGKWAEKKLQALNYKYINHFSACWVPDVGNENALAGELSHPSMPPKTPVKYIGLLSRFEKKEVPIIYKAIIILSGPEPQRTILEKKIITELSEFKEKAILIRGLPNEKNSINISPLVEVYNHLSGTELNMKICQSEWVICRSGYSSIMDLMRLGKKSILIPTPGQSEQEYLGQYLLEKKWALKIAFNHFSLQQAINDAENFSFVKYNEGVEPLLDNAIENLLWEIKEQKKD